MKNKGFTLIELLVVISIISLLSSVVLSSVNSARNKAKDATVKQEVAQFVNSLNLNYNDYGSYCNLQNASWVTTLATCSSKFSGTYATQAQSICNKIYENAGTPDATSWPNGSKVFFNSNATALKPNVGCNTTYSIMVYLNNGKWYCSGSSGDKGEYASYGVTGNGSSPGCFTDP